MLRVQTRVCQNECGGHGSCDQATRKCICQVTIQIVICGIALSSFYHFFAAFCPHYIYIFCIVLSSFYILQPAWMENFASTWIWGGESNCSWSVVYVCVIGKQPQQRISVSTFFFRWWPFCSRSPFLLLDLVQKVEGLPLCP